MFSVYNFIYSDGNTQNTCEQTRTEKNIRDSRGKFCLYLSFGNYIVSSFSIYWVQQIKKEEESLFYQALHDSLGFLVFLLLWI